MGRKQTSLILKEQTRVFARKVVDLFRNMKKSHGGAIALQFLRSGTSIGANLAEGRYAQTPSDALAKYYIAQKEAAESLYWIELFSDIGAIKPDSEFATLHEECSAIISLISKMIILKKQAKLQREKKIRETAKPHRRARGEDEVEAL